MTVLAWFAIVMGVLSAVAYPYLIGKNPNYTFTGWFRVLLEAAILVILAGRVLGWW